ncbi:DciA family protein [Pseudonocardia spinosispora]|uniref:DciA family protein n=1 Tax=Pseudonocardia spinosispora TaxID=103441 RepID=UPI003CCB87AE
MDTVDNSGSVGDAAGQRPPAAGQRPLDPDGLAKTVLNPGDKQDPPLSEPASRDGQPLTGSDLARDALRAAQQAAAARGRAPGQGTKPGRAKRGAVRGRRRRSWSGAGPDDRDPQPFGRLISRTAVNQGWNERLTSASVFGRWAELVGADVAEHATPLSLRDGELTVAASSTAWATQLRLLQRQLLVKIAAGVGPNVVRKMKIQGPSAPSWRKGLRHAPGRGPRDTYG